MKTKAVKITFKSITGEVKELNDRRRLDKLFVKEVCFETECYDNENYSCSILEQYTQKVLTSKHFLNCEVGTIEPMFRARDYVFTQRQGMYRINIDGDSLERHIQRYTDEFGLNFDPEYQRGYVWTEEQKVKYIEYLLSGGPSGREIYFNMPGWMNKFDGTMEVVDGKQRISTIVDFFNNKLYVFGGFTAKDMSEGDLGKIYVHCNVNDLRDKQDVVRWYLSMNNGVVIDTEEDLLVAKRLLDTK